MNTRPTEIRHAADVRAQIALERMFAAKRAQQDAREARYRASRERAMRYAERERILRAWRHPAPRSFWQIIAAEVAAEVAAAKNVWQQIAQEIAAAPIHMKVGTAVFFGAGAGAWVALLCGWLR